MIVAAAILVDGKIYTGRRHCNIIHSAKERGLPKGFFVGGEQGFVDDKGNFLDREEGAKYALACGQIKELKFNKRHLFSEDLW